MDWNILSLTLTLTHTEILLYKTRHDVNVSDIASFGINICTLSNQYIANLLFLLNFLTLL